MWNGAHTSKLNVVAYGLIIFGIVMLAFDLFFYWLSLQPSGCYMCAPREYRVPGVLTFAGILFMGYRGHCKVR
jgi:hypothetical protein